MEESGLSNKRAQRAANVKKAAETLNSFPIYIDNTNRKIRAFSKFCFDIEVLILKKGTIPGAKDGVFLAFARILYRMAIPMEKFITVTNQKGGVGKTTTSLSLINALHMRGRRVLGVDLDPQGSLGFSAGLDIENSTTVYDVFKGTASVEQAIVPTDLGDILPSNILLSTAELEFNSPGREYMLKNELQKIAHLYDHIIIDTPPALNVLTVNAYVASDALIIPMAPEILSLLGISQILDTINTVRKYYNPDLRVLGILLNKYNMRLTLNREVLELSAEIARRLDTKVFETKIRTSVTVAEAPAHGESVLSYAPNSNPALDFQNLLDELMGNPRPWPPRR